MIRVSNIEPKVPLPFFARENYLKSISNYYGWITDDNLIVAFVIKKQFIFKVLSFTSKIIAIEGETEEKYINDFINEAYILVSKSLKVDLIQQQPAYAFTRSYPKGSKFINFGSYTLDLSLSHESLLRGMHQKHRNVIKKGRKDELEIKSGVDCMDEVVGCVIDTMKRQHKPSITREKLLRIYSKNRENIQFFSVNKDRKLMGSAIIFFDDHTAYYMHAGTPEKKHNGAQAYLLWEIIKEMKAQGCLIFDFVGARIDADPASKFYSIQRFKKRFGAELSTGYLWKANIKPLRSVAYRIMLRTFHVLKGLEYTGDIIDQENRRKR